MNKVWYVKADAHTCVGYDPATKRYVGGDSDTRTIWVTDTFEKAFAWLKENAEDYARGCASYWRHMDGDMTGLYFGVLYHITSVKIDSADEWGRDEVWFDVELNEIEDVEALYEESYDQALKFRPYWPLN